MIDAACIAAILDSLHDPLVFVDTHHVIRYMNQAAIRHYEEGAELIDRSVFDCHDAQSRHMIRDVFAALEAGEEERCITDNKESRIHMRAVRDAHGQLIGYYERYEPPVS